MKIQIKYGFDGLKAVVLNSDNSKKLGTITITKNMKEAFDFIGLSWSRFQEGFDTIEEIFDYVISSPYFNPEVFKLENLNAINRARNSRRTVYNQFVEYVKDMEPKHNFDKNKDNYIQLINDSFPDSNLLARIEELKLIALKKKQNHAKFNGNIIMEKFPDLSGAELGKSIGGFQNHIGNITFEDYLSSNTAENIMNDFTKYYQNAR